MSVTDYDLALLYNRLRETSDDIYRLKRDLEVVRRIAEEAQRTCQALSSSSPESSTPTLPASS